MSESKPKIYREIIDALVRNCRQGQGQIASRRARDGVWNQSARADFIPDQHEINLLLARLSPEDRETIAQMLAQAFVSGVFNTLVTLETFQVPPFEDGYEGSPYNDFIGRLQLKDWDWPES